MNDNIINKFQKNIDLLVKGFGYINYQELRVSEILEEKKEDNIVEYNENIKLNVFLSDLLIIICLTLYCKHHNISGFRTLNYYQFKPEKNKILYEMKSIKAITLYNLLHLDNLSLRDFIKIIFQLFYNLYTMNNINNFLHCRLTSHNILITTDFTNDTYKYDLSFLFGLYNSKLQDKDINYSIGGSSFEFKTKYIPIIDNYYRSSLVFKYKDTKTNYGHIPDDYFDNKKRIFYDYIYFLEDLLSLNLDHQINIFCVKILAIIKYIPNDNLCSRSKIKQFIIENEQKLDPQLFLKTLFNQHINKVNEKKFFYDFSIYQKIAEDTYNYEKEQSNNFFNMINYNMISNGAHNDNSKNPFSG